jgi:hypothetical protein
MRTAVEPISAGPPKQRVPPVSHAFKPGGLIELTRLLNNKSARNVVNGRLPCGTRRSAAARLTGSHLVASLAKPVENSEMSHLPPIRGVDGKSHEHQA